MHIKYGTSEFVLGPFEFSSFGTIIGYRTLVSDFFRLRLESAPGSVPGPPVRRSCDSDIGRLVIRSVGLWNVKMRIKHFQTFQMDDHEWTSNWMTMNDHVGVRRRFNLHGCCLGKAGKRIDDSVVSFCQFASLIEYMVEGHSVDLRIPSF